jgi:L-seryl-tRNA(Ser) seleniumtransferase
MADPGHDKIVSELRKLPSVDALLQNSRVEELVRLHGRQLVVDATRQELAETRQRVQSGGACPTEAPLAQAIAQRLTRLTTPTLSPVINATGVVLHTNLGRAPLSSVVLSAMVAAGEGYSNLEFDLEAGRRGSRYVHAEALLCQLTGAEAALLVNNNAGAVLLALMALCHGREVVISRGQLVEIGGGFRIPDVMAQSGARLVEVGTTNRTYVRDYEAALNGETAALLRVHSSNFRVLGFAHQPTLESLCELAHQHDLLLMDDLGSGSLLDTRDYGLPHEPMVQESVDAGADLVCFSGDKLLGGPQAGIIVGRKEHVERLRHFPLTRALRVDKTTIAGVQANLLHYLRGEAETEIPVWRMIAAQPEDLAHRARALLARVMRPNCDVIEGRSKVGGGSLPEETLPTMLVALPGDPVPLAKRLRLGSPSVVARVQDDRVVLDLRTVLPEQEAALVARLRELLDG